MRRIRSSLVLLALSVGAILLAGLQLLTSHQPLPAGSSYSAQPDGVRALYQWSESVGARPTRLQAGSLESLDVSPRLLLIVEPETFFSDTDRASLDEVPRRGGTLVLAGENLFLRAYALRLGVNLEPGRVVSSAFPPGSSAALPIVGHDRVRASDATPLLISSDGEWLALQKPYLNGTLVVLATAQPLTNEGLRDDGVARFVYQTLGLGSLASQPVGFDEAHHSFTPTSAAAQVTLNRLLYDTSAGRAILYAGAVLFMWLLLSGRRLGPPLPARGSAQAGRTMFEHIQTVAGLYRRGRQLEAAREAFGRHYRRLLAQVRAADNARAAEVRNALSAIDDARSEAELVTAVARADDATRELGGSRS